MRNDVKIVLFSQFFSCHLKETKKGAQERGYMMCFWVLDTVKKYYSTNVLLNIVA